MKVVNALQRIEGCLITFCFRQISRNKFVFYPVCSQISMGMGLIGHSGEVNILG